MWILSKHSKQLAIEHSQLESVVLERTAQVQSLSQRLLKVQDDERRKLARDLHDSTGQTLVALKISASFLQEHCTQDPAARAAIAEVVDLVDQAIDEIRTMSYLLHPPLLDEVGFACAAEWYIDGFAKRSGVKATMNFAPTPERLPIGIEVALFRVLQESLTNVHRHSRATEVEVNFQRLPESIILEIRDHGCGIPPDRLAQLHQSGAETGVGVAGMRERMRELDGRLEIDSGNRGTILRAIVPLFEIALPVEFAESTQMLLSVPTSKLGLVDPQGQLIRKTWSGNQSTPNDSPCSGD